MICPNCNHENQGGNFCEKCGANLTAVNETAATVQASVDESTAAQSTKNEQESNQYLETTKNVSKQYFGHFVDRLKKPYENSYMSGSDQFVNGIITMVLYALFIPLIFFFTLKGLISDIDTFSGGLFGGSAEAFTPPFSDVVVKPFFAYFVFIVLVAITCFGAITLGKVQVNVKEVIGRFGSFLVPFVAILLIALLLSILKVNFSLVILLIGMSGSMFMVPPLVIASFKRNGNQGLDTFYGSLLTYVVIFILLYIMGDFLFEAVKSVISSFLSFGF
ncbi:zinc ribbon domain-containing protein [Radiobacillus kanasensis]|uniref:zinc ribbon domain-containing protein n=1 Tax=Radiobacillus kanasensis TaxID=2844358 RepID=UPI001E32BD13|nr:zinc ribbon domain-containing protein [Radiobacillus kanasensis]UFT99249.1 zinc ribbon domain-containing protein [Radiobacillus kanasensis]